MRVPTDEQTRKAAHNGYNRDGELEIDANAVVSRAESNEEHGAYVQAWIWISDVEVPGFENCWEEAAEE